MADFYGTEFTKTREPRDMIDVAKNHGRVRCAIDEIEATAAMAATDRIFLAKIPSDAVLLPLSTVYFDDLGTAPTLDFGDVNDPNGLSTIIAMGTAGNSSLLDVIGIEDYGTRLWEMLGYTTDPGGQLDLFLTVVGDITAAGTIKSIIYYVLD